MNKRVSNSGAMFFCSILVVFLLGEMMVRGFGHFDEDGNFFIHSLRCYPYRMPFKRLKTNIDHYITSNNSYLIFDPVVGWVPRPSSQSKNKLYFFNKDGLRTESCESVISRIPRKGVLRIAIYGDSFTLGDDNSFENTWGYYLENNLKERGIKAEVLNFGVGGYGMDQSFLRWRDGGYDYEPQIVLFGLSLENMKRNVNLIRTLYVLGTEISFFKPRFVFEQDKLKLINVPTPSPDQLVEILRHLDSWEYLKYEYWYKREDYQNRPWLKSKLVSFIYSFIKKYNAKMPLAHQEELAKLSLSIVSMFKESVESRGKQFYIIYLPDKNDLRLLLKSRKLPNSDFLKEIESKAALFNPTTIFLEEIGRLSMERVIPGHYSARANEIIGDSIADFILRSSAKYEN